MKIPTPPVDPQPAPNPVCPFCRHPITTTLEMHTKLCYWTPNLNVLQSRILETQASS